MNKRKITYKTVLPKEEEKPDHRFFRIIGVVILVFCLSVISFVGGRVFQTYSENPLKPMFFSKTSSVDKDKFNENAAGVFDTKLFWDVWETILNSYVDLEVIDEEEMYYGAIKGMVNSLGDSATIFLNPDETESFKNHSAGKYYEGIGAELGYRDGAVVVIAPIEGSPAVAAGVQAGDLILKVDDETIKSSHSIYDVVQKIRGDAGTEVVLTVLRIGESKSKEISIIRGEITVPSMTLDIDDSGIYVLKVSRWTDSSLSEWSKLWDSKVQEFLDSGSDKLIIDLRNNPGGFFDAAIYAAEDFLEKGTVVAKHEDRQGNSRDYVVGRKGKLLNKRVVVLVNGGSASASEIFAGALQYDDRVEVVGLPTYGKGTAQSVVDFRDGSSLHLTIIKWLLPDGTWLNQDNVVTPDHEVDLTSDDFKDGLDPQLQKAIEVINK